MNEALGRSLALLRQEKGLSQRSVAKDLGISQALLSHYEKGAREPGLAFVARACRYYNVSADFLLGLSLSRDGTTILDQETLPDVSEERPGALRGSVMAVVTKKLVVNSAGLLFDLLGALGSKKAIQAAGEYLGGAVYQLFRRLHRSAGANDDFFDVPGRYFDLGVAGADMTLSQCDYQDALDAAVREKKPFPDLSHDTLAQTYPGVYQSLLRVIHTAGHRVNNELDLRARMAEEET